MKIGCCVVLYNPDNDVIENIKAYFLFAEKIVIVDNSTKNIDEIENELSKHDKVVFLKQHENLGIAKALNIGLTYLYDSNFELALTMDQDSKFPVDNIDKMLDLVEKYSSEYSIIGLRYDNFRNRKHNKNDEIFDVESWITSGSFVNLKDYKLVGGFNDDLFIDSVDHEFCRQLVRNGKRIGILRDFSLTHQIGSSNKYLKLGKKRFLLSCGHPPIRNYYRTRNIIYLYKIDKDFYRKIKRDVFLQMVGAILCDKNKIENVKMICKGIYHGKLGKLGKYE